ncbi:MAG: efflux RND transporter permease subunit, partial [Pseudomonadota bacterium]
MKLSRFAVDRPVFTVMLALIVILLGLVSLLRLPIDLMPDISYPTLSISTSYSNASPEEMEEIITRPIEGALAAVPGVEEISSTSGEGSSSVRITFAWGTNLDEASNEVRDRIDRILPSLPEEVDRPRLRKFDAAAFPILILGASSELDPVQTRRLIDKQIKYRIERVPGVASLDIWGGLEREIHVKLDPAKIKALGLPLDLVLGKIRSENVDVPAGTIERGNYEVLVRTPGIYNDLDQLRNTVVAIRNVAPIQIKEIASVEDTWQKIRRIVRIDGKPGIRLSISKQSGKNTVEVARRVLKEIEGIHRDFPQIRMTPIIDQSEYIQSSISNVARSALYGGLLAVFVLLFFLRNFRSTAVIGVAIPISIIATFSLVYFGGFTLNIMTLGGLALGIGMLVDNS